MSDFNLKTFFGLTLEERRKIASTLTDEERKSIAESMFSPVRCGGLHHYDARGRPWYVHGGMACSPKEHNDIVRSANPTWPEESLKPYLLNEGNDKPWELEIHHSTKEDFEEYEKELRALGWCLNCQGYGQNHDNGSMCLTCKGTGKFDHTRGK